MGTHLYVCEKGQPTILAIEGTPPHWATCSFSHEGAPCDGAKLEGDAEPFTGGTAVEYRCVAGHARVLRVPAPHPSPRIAPIAAARCCPARRELTALPGSTSFLGMAHAPSSGAGRVCPHCLARISKRSRKHGPPGSGGAWNDHQPIERARSCEQ
jgi:hypothetical protein